MSVISLASLCMRTTSDISPRTLCKCINIICYVFPKYRYSTSHQILEIVHMILLSEHGCLSLYAKLA